MKRLGFCERLYIDDDELFDERKPCSLIVKDTDTTRAGFEPCAEPIFRLN